jgi:hypothetical protein
LLFSSENSVVSHINRYAAGWQLAGLSEDTADWQIVDPNDLIPVLYISAPVDRYPSRVTQQEYYPTPPPSPQYYRPPNPRTPEHYPRYDCPPTPEYHPEFEEEFLIYLMLSPTPIPRRSPTPPTPLTSASPPNPLRYRADPAPTPPRPIKKIRKRKAITIEQRALRV